MPLDLNLVGQPDSGYLTTGATDYANAVTAGKKSALELQSSAIKNEKSALDLSALKEKTARDTAISGRLPDLIGAADKAQLTAQNKADLMQYNPELANKVIATNDAKAKDNLSNFLTSNILKLTHSTDAKSDTAAILEAVNHYGVPLGLSDNPSPEELKNALMVAARGVDALKDTTMSTSPTGERITTTRAGEVTDIKPAEKVKQPVVPALDAKGNEITRPTNLGYGKKVIERKMSDGTWEKLGTTEPPAPREPKAPQGDLVQTENGYEFVPKGQIPKGKPLPSASSRPTEDEAKAAQWAVQAQYASDNMKRIFGINPSAANETLSEMILPSALANYVKSADRQQFSQAASAFSEAALRAATGAGVTESEAKQKIAELTPKWGDKPQVIKQKLDSIPIYLASLQTRAGRALAPVNAAVESAGTFTPGKPDKNTSVDVPSDKQSAYQLYVKHWNNAKNNPALQKQLTDRARQMGIVK